MGRYLLYSPEINVRTPPTRELEIYDTYRWVSGATTTHVWHAAFGCFVSPTPPLFARDGRVSDVPGTKVLDGAKGELDGHE